MQDAVVKKEQASREKYCRQTFWNEFGSLPLPLFLLESQVESEDGHPGGEEEGEEGEEDHHQHHPRHPGTKEIRVQLAQREYRRGGEKGHRPDCGEHSKEGSVQGKEDQQGGWTPVQSDVNIVPTSGPKTH